MAAPATVQGIGVFPQFIAQQPETLVIKEKVLSLSGDSFSIKTIDGRVIIEVKGEKLSLSGRKRVLDPQGNPLFDIRKKHIAIHTTFYCENPQGVKFFEVKSKFSIGSTKAIATFQSTVSGGTQHEFPMKGNFFGSKAEITDVKTGSVVAVINREFLNAGELIGGQQTYQVTVQPGVDLALISAMCICLDEKREQGKR